MSDIREALGAAFEKANGGGSDDGSGGAEASAAGTESASVAGGDTAAAGAEGGSSAATDSGAGESANAGGAGGRVRGPDGKFAKAEAASKTVAQSVADAVKTPAPKTGAEAATPPVAAQAAAATPAPAAAAPTATQSLKPPQSWKPEIREKFATLPPEIQAEIARTEGDWQKFKGESGSTRHFEQQFKQTIAPFEPMIRAEGGEPMKAIGSLLQTAAALRTGSPESKAHLVAQMIQSYGVPVEMLAKALDGAPQRQQAQAMDPQHIARTVREQVMQDFQAQAAQREQQQALSEAEAFAAGPGQEFIGDVGPHMAALLDTAAKMQKPMTLQEAYDQACWASPEVRSVLQQREQAKAAAESQAAAQKARTASVSVKTQPAAPTAQAPKGIRAALEEAMAKQQNRR